ncbi:hypothetical protein [Paenibacillus sp. R14(2021)]|uniref:hypothetical protein n=1 Tax=Paenibacillus sp. R14(2021) TaxID=2859228 RepID=UPI001C6142FE|nr:hypothetical protein [Paenibacillus sp. R14(2021)]
MNVKIRGKSSIVAALRPFTRIGLTPPETTYFNEIQSTVGNDPRVRIDPLVQLPGGNYLITLHVQGISKARALATLLLPSATPGAVRIFVRVKTSTGRRAMPITTGLTPKRIAALYRSAFRTNRLFAFAATRQIFALTYVYPVFKVGVIQFPNDDLSDYYGNYNNVTAFVFQDVLRKQINGTTIQFSSTLKKART